MNIEGRLYLAFPDGALTYDCKSCAACCCRGPALAFTPDELEIFPDADRASLAARLLSGPYVYLEAGPNGCQLLDHRNRCTVALRSGKSAMPLLCRLFPLSLAVRVGRFLALRPHFHACPLRLVKPPRTGLPGGHADVTEALAGQALVPFNLHEARLPAAETDDVVIAREVEFRDRCTVGLSGHARWSDLGTTAQGAAVEASMGRLGLPFGRPMQGADAMLLALAPSLRLSLLHLPVQRIDAALEILRRLLVRAAAGRGRDASGAFLALHGLTPAAGLLAWGSEPLPVLPADPRLPRFRQLRLTLAAALLMRDLKAGMGVVPALGRAVADSLSVAERLAFLVQMGRALQDDAGGPG